MKLQAKIIDATPGSDFFVMLQGHNGEEVGRFNVHGGENLTIEEYRRMDAAIAALINRDGLEL